MVLVLRVMIDVSCRILKLSRLIFDYFLDESFSINGPYSHDINALGEARGVQLIIRAVDCPYFADSLLVDDRAHLNALDYRRCHRQVHKILRWIGINL